MAGLLAHLGADPQGAEERQGDEEHEHTRWESYVAIAVGVVHSVVQQPIPDKQRKDGQAGGQKKSEERRGEREQEALKETEAFKGEPEKAGGTALGMGHGLRHFRDLSRVDRIQFHGQ